MRMLIMEIYRVLQIETILIDALVINSSCNVMGSRAAFGVVYGLALSVG
jgi:hypothetical protein